MNEGRANRALSFYAWILVFEQLLNGVQLGVTLFLMAAGLTLVLGIMNS